ncbi:MAG: Alpha-D-kanosaminyltransferase [Verrucomicrobia bacterium ADurb.Bin118]|jgi:glycosyltransferase involved in cell wall biosynthesis|nr:glycosyltransferase family 4 protein [Verrucomicrobiota bacterium]OQB90788.1 MAG: Alpha-D-kanosaminyltransferase [Verrucomicrobia bacterium ADurb.Bin118]
MRRLIISDIPTPWREPVFERVYQRLGGDLPVVYFKHNEKRRLWTFQMGRHPKTILKAITLTTGGTERFFNPGLLPFLLRYRPCIALIFASIKDPSGWLAMLLCRLLGTKVALLSDSWHGREQGFGRLRRLTRHLVYKHLGDAFVGASRQTLALYRHYNPRLREEQCFLSHLVADNDFFEQRLAGRPIERRFDILFSGRIVAVKNPRFFAEVCAALKARLGQCRVLIIGEGEASLKAEMREVFDRGGVTYEFAGFIRHEELPDYYAQARLLLLPTAGDCWGVVINEAMIAGTPVITTEWTAAAGELVRHEQNGYVLPFDVNAWAAAAADLLTDPARWEAFSRRARETVREFNYDNAAAGILAAFAYLENQVNPRT